MRRRSPAEVCAHQLAKAIVCAFWLLSAGASTAEAQFSEIIRTGTGAFVEFTVPPVTGALYCFAWTHNFGTLGPISIDGGNPGSGCRFDFQAVTPGKFLVAATPGMALSGPISVGATREHVFFASQFSAAPPPPPPPPSSLRIRAALNEDGPAPTPGVLLPQEARVPLGAVVRFEAIDQNGVSLPSTFSVGSTTVDEGVMDRALFGSSVLLAFLDSTGASKTFQAVHRGTAVVTVVPLDSAIPAGQITVLVENPQALGVAANDLDQVLFDEGHRSGIPPHFIKAHADKESSALFDRFAYRYEPVGGDISDLTAVSREENFRTLSPYSAYRLATAADVLNGALAAGALLTAADVAPRNRYFISCGADGQGGVNIQPSDTNVSAWEIFRCNNATHGRQNWARSADTLRRAALLESEPFTAQTGLAASFGLLQMTYVTAIDEMKWTGDRNGAKNPNLLFDSLENHDRLAGSLYVGVSKVVTDFRLRNPAGLWDQLGSADRFVETFVRAWSRYNRREEGYGASVATRITRYGVVPQSPIFGGPQ